MQLEKKMLILTDIQDLSRKVILCFSKNSCSQVNSCYIGLHYFFYFCYIKYFSLNVLFNASAISVDICMKAI